MAYQHPLAYLLGLEGVALLRAFAGEHDREFVHNRFDEVRQLLRSAEQFGDGVEIPSVDTIEGYRSWAQYYDEPGNGLIDLEQPIVHEIIDSVEPGVAVDAACGTGRHTKHLATRGHRVIAVDSSPEMLSRAKAKVPAAQCHEADLHQLPVDDAHVDLVVCALALTHVDDLERPFAEFARVLRPGGHLVISDATGIAAGIRPPVLVDAASEPGHLPHHNRTTGDYLRAALAVGLHVRRYEEPRRSEQYVDPQKRPSTEEMLPKGPPNIWSLHYWFPEATNAAVRGEPMLMVWHLQRDGHS